MTWPRIRRRLLWMLPIMLGACDRTDPGDASRTASTDTPRIVSLSPAISRTLLDLDLARHLVGRSAFCESVDSSIPVCGDLLHLDFERLTRVRPTHLLIQPPADGPDPALLRVAAERGWTVGQWHLDDTQDIEQLILDLPGCLFADGDPRQAGAAARAAALSNRLATALSPGVGPRWSGRTLMLSSTKPVLAFGHQTYLHDVLVALGGENAVDGRGWVTLSYEDLVRLDPAAIILIAPGVSDTSDADDDLAPLRPLDVAASRNGRLAILSHPDSLLPSSAVIEVATELRGILRAFAGTGL